MAEVDAKIYERLVLESSGGLYKEGLTPQDIDIIETSFLGEIIKLVKTKGLNT